MQHSLNDRLAIYRRYHTQQITKITHYIGVPALLIGVLMFLNWFSIHFASHWQISFAWLLMIGLLVYYYILNIRLGALMTIIMIIITAIAALLATPAPTKTSFVLFLVLVILGSAAQIIGHLFEKNKPDFVKSLSNLPLMPLLMVIELVRSFSWSKYFNIENEAC